MEYIDFHNEKLSKVVLGLMRINKKSSDEVKTLLESAKDSGINFLDIADVYGDGVCEQLVGEVFQNNPKLRDEFFLQSKCGIHKEEFTYYDFSKDYLVECVNNILDRLKTDHLDSLLLHRPDALMDPTEVGEAFDELYKSGKVRYFGVSNMNARWLDYLQESVKVPLEFNQLQLSCAHSPLVDQCFNVNLTNEESVMHDDAFLPYARKHHIIIQSWSSLQYGFFEGTFLNNDDYAALNERLDHYAKKYNVTPAAIALAWILRISPEMQAVIGSTNPQHVKEAAAAGDVNLTRKEWYDIYLTMHKLP